MPKCVKDLGEGHTTQTKLDLGEGHTTQTKLDLGEGHTTQTKLDSNIDMIHQPKVYYLFY
jgi:hypothetical protein